MAQFAVATAVQLLDLQNAATAVAFNAADLVDAVNDSATDKYADIDVIGDPINIGQAIVAYDRQSLDDPGVDTDHKFLVVARISIIGAGNIIEFQLPGAGVTIVGTDTGGLFSNFEHVLSALEVQTFRSNNGYLDTSIGFGILVISADGTSQAAVDVAFIRLEVPDAGPEPDVDMVSDAGLDFLFTNGMNVDVIADAGLEFDFSGDIETNDIISDAGLELEGDGAGSGNDIISDAGLEFNFTAPTIVSADSSGIYTFVAGQHFDRLLSRNIAANETQDVQIPEPFGKTGWFGG